MKRTENLNLPIYDNPESDIFKINDVNNAHETIDKQYKELKNIKETIESTNPSANLQGQINGINASLEKKASLQECKEEIAKAQLEGVGVDTSNFVFKSEINKILDISDVNEYQYDIIDGLCCWKSGLVQSEIGGAYGVKLNVKAGQKYLLSGISGNSNLPIAVFKSVDNLKSGNVVSFIENTNNSPTTYNDLLVEVPNNSVVMYLNSNDKTKISIKTESPKPLSEIVNEIDKKINDSYDNPWKGKKIVWFGTSIPAGGQVGSYVWELEKRLGCKIYNEAIGSSAVRAGCHAKITSDDTMGWKGCAFPNIAYALSGTLAEKEEIINNYSKYGWNVNLDDTHKQYIRNCSYERKLTKYLTGGSVGRCDLYVFDHGHNDCLTWNEAIDEMSVIPSNKKDRTYFIGAMNFLIDLILKDNPKAKIVFIGHYESDRKTAIYKAQNVLQSIWGYPLFKTWEKIGWNQNKITLRKDWIDGVLTDTSVDKEFTITKTWMADDLHPHSDLSGQAIQKYADILEPWFRYTLK